MKFFIDTAKVEDIKKANDMGRDLRRDHQSVSDRKRRKSFLKK